MSHSDFQVPDCLPPASADQLAINDIVVSRTGAGHDVLIVTRLPHDRLSLLYRGDGWNVEYAVARGARIASNKGGDLWFTSDGLQTVKYLETFRGSRFL